MSECFNNVPSELRPLFEVCFILGFGICESCGREQPFTSSHPRFSDGWWVDEARAMHKAEWVVPREQQAYCPECAARLGIAG